MKKAEFVQNIITISGQQPQELKEKAFREVADDLAELIVEAIGDGCPVSHVANICKKVLIDFYSEAPNFIPERLKRETRSDTIYLNEVSVLIHEWIHVKVMEEVKVLKTDEDDESNIIKSVFDRAREQLNSQDRRTLDEIVAAGHNISGKRAQRVMKAFQVIFWQEVEAFLSQVES